MEGTLVSASWLPDKYFIVFVWQYAVIIINIQSWAVTRIHLIQRYSHFWAKIDNRMNICVCARQLKSMFHAFKFLSMTLNGHEWIYNNQSQSWKRHSETAAEPQNLTILIPILLNSVGETKKRYNLCSTERIHFKSSKESTEKQR